jgi:pimeloyl-ACP methyl ester carboxylesterase
MTPLRDLGALLRRPATSFRFEGHRHVRITPTVAGEIAYEALLTADFHPFIRAAIPAALHLAAAGDVSALARLSQLSFGLSYWDGRPPLTDLLPPGVRVARQDSIEVDYLATLCEDRAFPWAASDPVAVRRSKLEAAAGALAVPSFEPFDRDTVVDEAPDFSCLGWPEAGDAPVRVTGPLPPVPTLVLSGEDDVRTPLEDARALATQMPNATLVSVPNSGHAVLASDDSGCAQAALAAFFAGQPIGQCGARRPRAVDPLPPTLGRLAALPGMPGTPGRTLRAATLTLRHDVGLVFPIAETVGFVNGTHDGFLRFTSRHRKAVVTLKDLSYVAGVRLSGRLAQRGSPILTGRLKVELRGRDYGVIDVKPHGVLSGRLGGREFRLSGAARERIDRQAGFHKIPLD